MLYRDLNILFCNLMCVYVHKLCKEKFGDYKKSFSWLGQKVNQQIDGSDTYGHDADDSSPELSPWQRDDAASWQVIVVPFNILTESEATEYLYLI